jgi:hypothetical protein
VDAGGYRVERVEDAIRYPYMQKLGEIDDFPFLCLGRLGSYESYTHYSKSCDGKAVLNTGQTTGASQLLAVFGVRRPLHTKPQAPDRFKTTV